MTEAGPPSPELCNCLALRQAARHVTRLYDRFLAPAGLRATQFSILVRLKLNGPMTVNRLAAELVMDRTTLGHNIRPLQREGLIAIAPGSTDRRSRELRLTAAGAARLRAGAAGWARAQAVFETTFGAGRAQELRDLLQAVAASGLHDRFPPYQEKAHVKERSDA